MLHSSPTPSLHRRMAHFQLLSLPPPSNHLIKPQYGRLMCSTSCFGRHVEIEQSGSIGYGAGKHTISFQDDFLTKVYSLRHRPCGIWEKVNTIFIQDYLTELCL